MEGLIGAGCRLTSSLGWASFGNGLGTGVEIGGRGFPKTSGGGIGNAGCDVGSFVAFIILVGTGRYENNMPFIRDAKERFVVSPVGTFIGARLEAFVTMVSDGSLFVVSASCRDTTNASSMR